jgi:hypothetical protein
MRGEKKAMHKNIYYGATIRKYKELSGDYALKQVQSDAACKEYIPDEWFKPQAKYSRNFCWGILATV